MVRECDMKMVVKRITHSSSPLISHPISLFTVSLYPSASLSRVKVSSSIRVSLFSLSPFVYPRACMYLSLY